MVDWQQTWRNVRTWGRTPRKVRRYLQAHTDRLAGKPSTRDNVRERQSALFSELRFYAELLAKLSSELLSSFAHFTTPAPDRKKL